MLEGAEYLNMRGRDSAAIITEEAEAERVCNAIAKGLTDVAIQKPSCAYAAFRDVRRFILELTSAMPPTQW
jgi:hypothetical protein